MKKFIDLEIMYVDAENFDAMLDEAVIKIKEGGVGGFINDNDKNNSCRFGVVNFHTQNCQTEKMSI